MLVSCEYVQERLSAYLDGECTAEETAVICAHLKECEQCTALLDSLKNISTVLPQAYKIDPPPSLHEDILAVMEEVKAQRRLKKIKLLRRWTGIAAAASVAVCTLFGVHMYLEAQRKAEALANAQKIAPVQQGFAYEMQTQWGRGGVDFSVPEDMVMNQIEEGVWSSQAEGENAWVLSVNAQNGTAILSNAANSISWEGIAFCADGIPVRLEFGELIYRINVEKTGIRLIVED